jgi:hypothetical protein
MPCRIADAIDPGLARGFDDELTRISEPGILAKRNIHFAIKYLVRGAHIADNADDRRPG